MRYAIVLIWIGMLFFSGNSSSENNIPDVPQSFKLVNEIVHEPTLALMVILK